MFKSFVEIILAARGNELQFYAFRDYLFDVEVSIFEKVLPFALNFYLVNIEVSDGFHDS